jgi:hypothetical protein
MRALSKTLAAFRQIIIERGQQLRRVPFGELSRLAAEPIQRVEVGNRRGTISIIVLPSPSGALRVVIQGFLRGRVLPVKDVAMDGFYKYPDGTVEPMPSEEFYDFD